MLTATEQFWKIVTDAEWNDGECVDFLLSYIEYAGPLRFIDFLRAKEEEKSKDEQSDNEAERSSENTEST